MPVFLREHPIEGQHVPTGFHAFSGMVEALGAIPLDQRAESNAIRLRDLILGIAPDFGPANAYNAARLSRRMHFATRPATTLESMVQGAPADQVAARQQHLTEYFGAGAAHEVFWVPPANAGQIKPLVCAMLVGHLAALAGDPDRVRRLIALDLANNNTGPQTMLSTGRACGIFFGLLNDDDSPTAFYNTFFEPGLVLE